MTLMHPFQKLCYVKASSDLPHALLAASGPYICSYSFGTGLVSHWPAAEDKGEDLSDDEVQQASGDGDHERPAKRQKFAAGQNGASSRRSSEDSVEIISERVKGQRRKAKPRSQTKLPDVSHILATDNGSHVIVITTDDKCVRVLGRKQDGRLIALSERCMPKRLCAIALTADEKTIVAGDKFGDVYSLPLFPVEDSAQPMLTPGGQDKVLDYKPSASELTVHTKGNLEALRQQQQQKQFKPKKEEPTFERRLLLGHVSLLTDLAIAEFESEHGRRQYILTADRDEHIRVSRGISQAHVIENYCLGHTEFVSKLCILPWQPSTLVAGSGEPSLKVYDWQRGVPILDLLSLDPPTSEYIKMCLGPYGIGRGRSLDHLAISGIWTMQTSERQGYIIAAFEGLPLLLAYFHDGEKFTRCMTDPACGNILDIAVLKDRRAIAVSIDTVHQMCSTKHGRQGPFIHGQPDAIFCLELVEATPDAGPSFRGAAQEKEVHPDNMWGNGNISQVMSDHLLQVEPALGAVELEKDEKQQKPHSMYSKLGEFLYGLENLRKQRGQEAVEAEEEALIDGEDALV